MSSEEHIAPPILPAPWPGHAARWLLPLFAFAVLVALVFIVLGKLRNDVWAYFTDDEGTRVEVADGKARLVLWQDPQQHLFTEEIDPTAPGDSVNQPTGRLEASFSANETTMVLVRWDAARKNADLYSSTWNGRVWTRPVALTSLNTTSNERGPAFSHDGRYLYFSSNRPGGHGGYDLYVAQWDGNEWSTPAALGTSINSQAQETGPALAENDSRLYFSSNRADGKSEDIFVATRLPETTSEPPAGAPAAVPPPPPGSEAAPVPPPVPRYAKAEPVSHLNSSADDVQAALTRRGDQVFLASDRERRDEAGFEVYFSRVVDGEALPPERVDLYFKGGEVTDPAVRMEGFDLLFSRRAEIGEDGYRLYRSTTREVTGYTDLARWEQFRELMMNIGGWILLALVALIALLYLLEAWHDITNLFHKCLAGSAAVHLIIVIILMLWLIVREVDSGGELQAPQVAVSIEALAQAQLAMESEPDQAQIAESNNAVVTEKLESDFKIPVFTPQLNTVAAPVILQTASSSLVPDVRPSRMSEAESERPVELPAKELTALTSLPQTFLPEPENPELQEQQVSDQQIAEKPADPADALFKPTEALEQVQNEQARERRVADTALEDETEAREVARTGSLAQTVDTGGEIVIPHRGLEARGSAPELQGAGDAITNMLNLIGDDPQSDPLLPGELETPRNDLDPRSITRLIQKQRGKPSLDTIKQLGGSDATERAIGEALEWFARNQEGDGRWDVRKHGANGDYDTAGAGLALLCFYGWGVRHDQGGQYQQNVLRALDWLLKQQKENGDLRGKGRMYCHGLATIALCEAYGATQDPKLREPAEKAIALIVASQSPSQGGWRYEPADQNGKPNQDADLSVTGWQYMALHSARLAGMDVPEEVLVKARRYLDQVASGKHGGLYGYQKGKVNPSMVATGMFCRQLDLVPPTDARMPEGAQFLGLHKLNTNPDFYYVYYATLALYQHQGPVWQEWNEQLKEILPSIQKKIGAERGSWDRGAGHGGSGGRVVSTALCVLSLEVYYRLLPMYGFRGYDALPEPKRKGKN